LNQATRLSGLAHILSISGLHMVIMAETVFWLVRALLAFVPALALRFPIKKWAAAAALWRGGPTVRSWIMMSIVLIAVMLDRPALTKRNVALAALAILVVAPESLFDPSFEMSFAAVVALVALYEWLSERKRDGLRDVNPYWAARLGTLCGGSPNHARREHRHRTVRPLSLPSHDALRADRKFARGATCQPRGSCQWPCLA